jgi:hypothetical protein
VDQLVRWERGERVLFFRGDLPLFAFLVAALFLIAVVRVRKRQPQRRSAVWLLGVTVAAWFGYGMWELHLLGGEYLRLDLVYLWPLLLLVSVFTIVWIRAENCDGAHKSAPPDPPHE